MLRLLEVKSFDQITIRHLVAEAGVHYATFFRHHPTKEALLDHVAAGQIQRLVELAVPVEQQVDLHAGFLTLCEYVDAHRTLWTALLTGGAAGAMRAELLRVSSEIAVTRSTPDLWLPVELGVACTVNLIVETIVWWLKQDAGTTSPSEVAAILTRLTTSLELL
ncbi:TetR/AcrR family transcriptional regulator [Sphingomonas ginsenosidivorax]|nr:TetR/AcrR family transcriptional regulator [Sphingomonas ginsenosidivorax]